MEWTRGEPMTAAHRERLRAAGVEADALDGTTWRRVTAPLPDWWSFGDNTLYLADGATLPEQVVQVLTSIPTHDVVVAVGSALRTMASLLVGGDRATVFIGPGCELTAGDVYCGPDSQVVLHGPLVATRSAVLDARNGGSIVAAPDQLWAADVYLATDDMHRLEDRSTGERLNPYGGTIRIDRHVWLCREAVLTGHVEVGEGACVGMRAVVRGQKVPAHTVVAGAPARVVREDATWSWEDRP